MKNHEFIFIGGVAIVGILGLYLINKTPSTTPGPAAPIGNALGQQATAGAFGILIGAGNQVGQSLSDIYGGDFPDESVQLKNGPGTPLYDAAQANAAAGYPVN